MASGFIGNEVPRKGLRVRVPCPPLPEPVFPLAFFVFHLGCSRFDAARSCLRLSLRVLFHCGRIAIRFVCNLASGSLNVGHRYW